MSSGAVRFDLLEQSWIQAVDLAGCACELSVREVLARAQEISCLSGELPTQSFAILRLLLAIVRRSLGHKPGTGAQTWGALWREDRLPMNDITAYLDRYRDRFDLFDPHAPFFQVPDLRSSNDEVKPLDKLIADVPNGEKYFTTRAGASVERIEFAEAARWLVHVQAFDPSGIKTGAVGDTRVKGGKGYPIGVAWTGCLGGVFLEGATLRETLLLNLVLRDRHGQRFAASDAPAWERERDTACERPDTRPMGPDDVATWQSRRVRLVHDGAQVTGLVLCNGDAIEPFNKQAIEPMTGWRYSEIQSKKSGQPRHYPMTHDPDRALWRGFTALIREVATPATTAERPIAPGVVEWMRYLIDEEELEPTHPVRLHATGMQYINNQSVVGEVFDDSLGFRVALLASDPNLRTCALNGVQVADEAVAALANLAANLALAAGGDPDGARARARQRGYFSLEDPYRRWLAALKPIDASHGYGTYEEFWQGQVRRVIEPAGADLVATAGMPAWRGREVRGTYVDSARAQIWFRRKLREVLAGAYPRNTGEGESAA